MKSTRVVHLSTAHRLKDPRIFYKQCVSLRAAGYDVHLVAQHDCDETVDGIPVVALPLGHGRHHRTLIQRTAYQRARQLEADLYHFHDPELIPVAYALQKATGARIIYDMHEDYAARGGVEGRLLRGLEHWCFSWVDHVVIAEEGYETIVRGVPHTPVLNYFFSPNAQRNGNPDLVSDETCRPFRLCCTGVQSAGRGLNEMIDLAYAFLQAGKPWQLDIVGICHRECDRAHAMKRIRTLKLEDTVRLTGWDRYLSWPQMAPFFREAHVGLALMRPHPNYRISIPTKFYEYLHFGLPIVCTDFPLWRAFIEENECGAVVDPGNVAELMRLLSVWDDDRVHYRELSDHARASAPKYRWSAMEDRLRQIYANLLQIH